MLPMTAFKGSKRDLLVFVRHLFTEVSIIPDLFCFRSVYFTGSNSCF